VGIVSNADNWIRKPGAFVMRQCGKVLICLFLLGGSLRAAEYKGAIFKGVKNHKLAFEVNGQEVILGSGSLSFKSFDADGKPITGFTQNVRVLVPGNVVDLVAGKRAASQTVEDVLEVRLVKGQIAEPGITPKWPDLSEPRPKRGRGGQDKNKTTYKAATIKSVDKKNVVLEVDGKEITVVRGRGMKFVDADGKQMKGKGVGKQVLKEGNQVDVTTSKGGETETIREVHLVHATGDEK
jgi:hypothetical protein